MKKQTACRAAAWLSVLCLCLGGALPAAADTQTSAVATGQTDTAAAERDDTSPIAYTEFLAEHPDAGPVAETIEADVLHPLSADGAAVETADGRAALRLAADDTVRLAVRTERAGLYRLCAEYMAVPSENGAGTAIQCALLVNGEIAYKEARYLEFSRAFRDASAVTQDESGDDKRPAQTEVSAARRYTLYDTTGYEEGPLYLYLHEGENELTLSGVRGGLYLFSLTLGGADDVPDYAAYRQRQEGRPSANAEAQPIVCEAETVHERSHQTVIMLSDASSIMTTPSSPRYTRLNIIGGENWKTVGQWLSWQFTVTEPGFYTIGFRYKQDVYPGTVSYRRVQLDGETPFRELDAVGFPYGDDWATLTLGGETPYEIYLDSGVHTLTLTVTLGEMAQTLKTVKGALTALNEDYLTLLTYLGSNPDIYRDYGFDELVPEVIEDIGRQYTVLTGVSAELKSRTSQMGENTVVLDRLAATLKKMADDPDEIARNFSSFKDGLSSIGTWLTTYSAQPLALDKLCVAVGETGEQLAGGSFFADLWFNIRRFFVSFTRDYSENGAKDGETLTVWTALGRDQREIVRRLTEEDFTRTYGIRANVQLVAAGALLPNILAGTGPDVYLSAGGGDPINYAIRGAVLDLRQFSDCGDAVKAFHPQSLVGFTYKDGLYALPESLSFPVLFYRKDVFRRFGVEPPQTWSDFYELLAIFQQNNLSVGLSYADAFNIFLYQLGGEYYAEDRMSTALISNEGIAAFKNAMELYTAYGLPPQFDFANRFRSGEMPMGIADYMLCNQLTVFAPEIQGEWGFTTIPGTVREDGSVDRTAPASSNAAIILSGTKMPDEAWTFLKWWTSAKTQTRYGLEMETVVDVSSRQPAATLEAMRALPWTQEQLAALNSQWASLKGTPQIPGSYYVSRVLDFAFNDVYGMGADAVETWEKNLADLDAEIVRKSKEFADSN